MFGFPHGQDGSVFQTRQEGGDVLFILYTHENNLTAFHFLEQLQMFCAKWPVSDGLSADALVQHAMKLIFAERTENQRSIRIFERIRGPFRKLREVKQKCRFDCVFARGISLRRGTPGNR